MKHILALLMAAALHQPSPPRHEVTMEGCIQATGSADVFLLAVPARFADPDRGIATGEPVPRRGGLGPEPRQDPRTVPPVTPTDSADSPQGRYQTRTMLHRSFRLHGIDPSRLEKLVGAHVRVVGAIATEGFPSGDARADTRAADSESTFEPLNVRELTVIDITCHVPLEP